MGCIEDGQACILRAELVELFEKHGGSPCAYVDEDALDSLRMSSWTHDAVGLPSGNQWQWIRSVAFLVAHPHLVISPRSPCWMLESVGVFGIDRSVSVSSSNDNRWSVPWWRQREMMMISMHVS